MVGNAGFPYTNTNKPLGLAAAATYFFDANEGNANMTAVADFAGMRFCRGVNCVDNGSNPNQCVIWLETHPGGGVGSRETADVNAWAMVVSGNDGAGGPQYIWEVQCQVVGADVFILFSDAVGLQKGVAPTGIAYNNAAFIDGLGIFIVPTTTRLQLIDANLLFSNVDAGGINASTIPRAAGASDVETDLAQAEADIAAEHSSVAPGQHNPEIIVNDRLNVDCFAPDAYTYESCENIVDGDFEFDDNGDGVVNGWLPYLGPPTVQLSAAQVKRGTVSQLVTTAGAGPGINAFADNRLHAATDFQGMTVSMAALVYATHNDSVILQMNDGVGLHTRPAGGVAGAWRWLHFSGSYAAGANQAEFRIWANQATTFYVAAVKTYFGRLNQGYANAPGGVTDRLLRHSDAGDNWFPNGDISGWTNNLPAPAVVPPPDWWTATVGVPVFVQNAAIFLFGQYSMDVTLAMGDAIQLATINPLDFVFPAGMVPQEMIMSFYHYGVGAGNSLQIQSTDGVAVNTDIISPANAAWNRYIARINVAPASVAQTLTITALAPGNVLFDGFMCQRGQILHAFRPSSGLQPHKWDFVHAGAAPGFPQNMTSHGSLLENLAPSDMYLHKLMVYNAVAPGGAIVDTYDVTVNGAVAGITATVTGAALVGATHVPGGVFVNQGDRIQVLQTPGGGATADIIATVEGLKIGS